jgi:hypothetical protein
MQVAASLLRMTALPNLTKTGIVAGGYVAAVLIATLFVSIYIDMTSGPDREASGGMYSFGDSLLFIAVFGIVSTIPTGLALYFLRRNRVFWGTLCAAALLMMGTGLLSVVIVALDSRNIPVLQTINVWFLFAVPRIFVAPFVLLSFWLAALVAPDTRFRRCLWAAAAGELITGVYGFFHWFVPMFSR